MGLAAVCEKRVLVNDSVLRKNVHKHIEVESLSARIAEVRTHTYVYTHIFAYMYVRAFAFAVACIYAYDVYAHI